ncbi:MAG: BspA family leucine-rich repeat surface protein [[Clostridium] innocuum]
MGKTKKAGIIARTLTCLMATAAIALSTASPAFAASEVTDCVDTSNISVTVPAAIPCTMMADGTVVAPSGLTIVNSGDAVVMDAYTADAMGNAVDFTLDIGGTRALSRTGGKDSAPASGIDFSSGSKELRLKVSKLDRKINAALMDKASSGGTDMLKLGFKFSEKALQGVVSISGDTTVGSTLTATTSNLQADAKPSYQWYRDGSVIPGATGGTYTTVEADAGHEIICKVTDSSGRYSGVLTSNVITPVQPEPVAFAVFSADDSSLNFYKRPNVPEAGTRFEGKTATEVYTGIETNRWFGYERPWDSRSASIWSTKVVDVIQPEYTTSWFKDCSNLISVDLRKLDTSNVKKMDQMFWDCSSLRTLDVSGFNTGNVDTMASMFDGCSNLVELDVSGFNTSNVTEMGAMFYDCSRLRTLDVSGFDTSKADSLKEMFSGCSTLTELDVSGFVTSNVEPGVPSNPTGIKWMFADCQKIKFLDLTGFDTRNLATNAGALSAFSNNRMLERIKVGRNCIANFPRPDKNYIPGADGKWYNSRGVGFTPDKIPSNVADTYNAWDPNLHGSVNITGDMQNGLKAKVSGAQSDAKLAFEWHRKRTVTDSFTWDIPMLTPAQRTISVGENAYIEVSMMDSNPVRNGYTIVVTGDSGEVYRQTFVEFGTAAIQIPTSGVYFLRIENTDPTAHTAYVRITSDKDSLIAGAASDSIGVSEAGDYYCVVTDTSGKYKGQLVSNTLTVR